MELDRNIPALTSEPGIGGIYAVFWWHDMPVGHLEIPAANLPLPASQHAKQILGVIRPVILALINRQNDAGLPPETLASLADDPAQDNEPQSALQHFMESIGKYFCPPEKNISGSLSTSVLICTRDRPDYLARCLHSLEKMPQSPAEIIVIDNAPASDATRNLVSRFANIRYVLEPRPGLDLARNTGLRHSSGEIIAFLDDDIEVHPAWLGRLHKGFTDPQVMAVTGLVLPAELETEAQFLFETHWGFNRGYFTRQYDTHYFQRTRGTGSPVWEIGAGANMAFRRRIFELVHDFDERLDVGAAGCSGDSEFWYRILAAGWTCIYEPAAVVFHYHRREMVALQKQLFYYMRGHVTALIIQFEKYHHWGNLLRLFFLLPYYYIRLSVQGCLYGFQKRYQTLGREIGGCLSGLAYYLSHKRPK